MSYPRPTIPGPDTPVSGYQIPWAFSTDIDVMVGTRSLVSVSAGGVDGVQSLRNTIGRLPQEMTHRFFRAAPMSATDRITVLRHEAYTFTITRNLGRPL